MTGLAPRPRPCPTCPYRRDVPPGVWAEEEYAKLERYDGDVPDHVEAGAFGLFHCHTTPEFLCSGWVGCHDMNNMLAVRLHWRDLDTGTVQGYVSPVPLFGSGAEAAAHGRSGITGDTRAAQLKALRYAGRRARILNKPRTTGTTEENSQ